MDKKYKIYMLTFPNGKKYCGYTSRSLKARWNNGKGYEKCPLVYRAILKYGWENVTKELLFSFDNKEEALEKERETIAALSLTNPDYGYNIHEGGKPTGASYFSDPAFIEQHRIYLKQLWQDPAFREKMSKRARPPKREVTQAERQRMSEIKKGQVPVNRRPVIQLDPKTFEEIGDYPSASHAALAVCGSVEGCSNILNVCKGRRKTAYKYAWRFQEES